VLTITAINVYILSFRHKFIEINFDIKAENALI
jgi:hypothetical protein